MATIDPRSDRAADRSSDWLEAALIDDAAEHASAYLPDGGFTARVLDALPAAVQPLPAWRKPAVTLLWGAAAAGAFIALPDLSIDIAREALRLLAAQSLPNIGAALALIGLASWSAAAYALRND